MIQILRKEGWQLNPSDKIVNAILKRIEYCDGECPCLNPGKTVEERLCPCKEYRENNSDVSLSKMIDGIVGCLIGLTFQKESIIEVFKEYVEENA